MSNSISSPTPAPAKPPYPIPPAMLRGMVLTLPRPPADAPESAVLDLMRQRFDHVSAERILSGPALVNL